MTNECLICRRFTKNNVIHLSNMQMIHSSCFERANQEYLSLTIEGEKIQRLVDLANKEIREQSSIVGRLSRFLRSHDVDLAENLNEVNAIYKNFYDRNTRFKNIYSEIFSLLPFYPPDWETRREEHLRHQDECQSCGSDFDLHVHHVVPIKSGGNHRPNNLRSLCRACHEKTHGHFISGKPNDRLETKKQSGYLGKAEFQGKINTIEKSAEQKLILVFRYKKFLEEKSSIRKIRDGQVFSKSFTGGPERLYVRGFCLDRQSERTFALERMTAIRTIKIATEQKS